MRRTLTEELLEAVFMLYIENAEDIMGAYIEEEEPQQSRSAFFCLPLLYFSYHIHGFLGKANRKAMDWVQETRRNRV